MANIENRNVNKKIIKIVSLLMLKRKEDRRGRRACERERDFKTSAFLFWDCYRDRHSEQKPNIFSKL